MKTWLIKLINKYLVSDYIGSIVRHTMTLLGGFLVAKGLSTPEAIKGALPEMTELVLGIITAAIGQGLSFVNKKTE
jgi:hypothetical protein